MWGNQSRQQDNFDPYDYEESPLDDHEVKKEQQRTPRKMPNIWPDMRPKPKPREPAKEDDHMEKLAEQFRVRIASHPQRTHSNYAPLSPSAHRVRPSQVGDRIMVETHEAFGIRRAEVRWIGQLGFIAPGWWIGVQYDLSLIHIDAADERFVV